MSQDIRAAVRPVLFGTRCEEFPYSFQGSLFVITFKGRCYGLTCHHVIGEDGAAYVIVLTTPSPESGDLHVTVQQYFRAHAPDNSLGDAVVLCFPDEVDSNYFKGMVYSITEDTIGMSWIGDRLRVVGCLNTKTIIDPESKSNKIVFCDQTFFALGCGSFDPFLCQASTTLATNDFVSLDGISGAPVFNETTARLCGMVVRAGIDDYGKETIWYIDICDIVKLVQAAHGGSLKVHYVKYLRKS